MWDNRIYKEPEIEKHCDNSEWPWVLRGCESKNITGHDPLFPVCTIVSEPKVLCPDGHQPPDTLYITEFISQWLFCPLPERAILHWYSHKQHAVKTCASRSSSVDATSLLDSFSLLLYLRYSLLFATISSSVVLTPSADGLHSHRQTVQIGLKHSALYLEQSLVTRLRMRNTPWVETASGKHCIEVTGQITFRSHFTLVMKCKYDVCQSERLFSKKISLCFIQHGTFSLRKGT